ncbi:hypothetical protein EV356DRAFT_528419 [Viridothelium virens]|uniref:Uncharacterized protein n=1 Tax=Viridothelium virens TaxID=1048519 RepID=A0A6A6HLU2_VIRVR|nr:hypothetical protein EV356DRAFT_528419 [Viridothelium virens]
MHDLSNRSLVVGLRALGYTSAQVSSFTGVPTRTATIIFDRACSRGFDPSSRPLKMKDEYIKDAPKSGRPRKDGSNVKKKPDAKPNDYGLSKITDWPEQNPSQITPHEDGINEEAWVDEADEGQEAGPVDEARWEYRGYLSAD